MTKTMRGVFLTAALTFGAADASLAQTWDQVARPGYSPHHPAFKDPLGLFKTPAEKLEERLDVTRFELGVAKAIHAFMQDQKDPAKLKAVQDALEIRPGRAPSLNVMIGFNQFKLTGRMFPFDNADSYQKSVIAPLEAAAFRQNMDSAHLLAASAMRQLSAPAAAETQIADQPQPRRDTVAKGRPKPKQNDGLKR